MKQKLEGWLVLLAVVLTGSSSSITVLAKAAHTLPIQLDIAPLHYIANISYAGERENNNPTGLSSLFSPRMDFDQWKPLTGRGDPLRNDPTYDYEPPVLERVHYWADETRYEREHYPERKSEVLMLGVSSRRPSVASRPSAPPPRRQPRPPSLLSTKYEEFAYKLSDRYPMTILVPPPPPPPGHQHILFAIEDKPPLPTSQVKFTESPALTTKETALIPEPITSSYALQEANLVYQSSSTHQNWIINNNQTKSYLNNPVSSDYAGWGPTTPIDENEANDTHNFIFKDQNDYINYPYLFYKPMLSEAPPPPGRSPSSFNAPTFMPTAVPPTPGTILLPETTEPTRTPHFEQTFAPTTESYELEEEVTTAIASATSSYSPTNSVGNVFDMMASMFSMPLVNGPERPEDNLYAHASDNLHVFKEQPTESINIETLQTMQPPPPSILTETTTASLKRPFHVNAHSVNHLLHKQPTQDPYLHMRHTTPKPKPSFSSTTDDLKETEILNLPSYLIIQGHSKVKTYGSKPKEGQNRTQLEDIPNPNETNEVKHLHPIKDKHAKHTEKPASKRLGRVRNLQTLVDRGLGSIEIQETDIGIKYDVSDGSYVPIEIYRKGIVESDENNYSKTKIEKRRKRQISLEDLLPVDEDTLEEYVYNFLKSKRNETGITGLIAKAVTGNATKIFDALEDDDDDDDEEDER